jgi:hypothetical protein
LPSDGSSEVAEAGLAVDVLRWDDAVDWAGYDLVVVRSCWTTPGGWTSS